MNENTIPRRNRIDLMTPAELAIRNAMIAVETVGADVLLTDAVILLGQARDKVADFVDRRKVEGWEWSHEHDAKLLARDGWMCERHPGVEWPHDDCAGPGQSWAIEGKEQILSLIEQPSARQ